MTRYLVVTNADAGSNDAAALASAVEAMRAEAAVEVRATCDQDQLDTALDDLDGRTMVAAGGDGTIHLIVNRLHDRGELADVPVGLIPLGTGNDLARGVAVPLEPEEAARVVLGGLLKPMDVVVADDGVVVVNAVHVGVGAEAARAAEPWKRRLSPLGLGKLGYVVGALIAGVGSEGLHLQVVVDGRDVSDGDRRVLQVGISNGSNIGGGTELAPSADPGDGRADVTISFAVRRWDRLLYGVRLKRGTHEERHDVTSLHAREVRISGEQFWCNSDGELTGPIRDCSWVLEPSAFRLLVPAAGAAGDRA